MDINLKNKHRLGVFLSWLLVVAAAAGMVCAYPYIKERAYSYQGEYGEAAALMEEQNRMANLGTQLTAASYSMWEKEEEAKSQEKLMPSQVFVPELERLLGEQAADVSDIMYSDESGMAVAVTENWSSGEYDFENREFLLSVRSNIDERAKNWDDALEVLGGTEQVRVTDEKGQEIQIGGETLFSGSSQENEEDRIRVSIVFDSKGRSSLGDAEGDPEAVRILQGNRYYFENAFDPLAEDYGEDYVYRGISFQGPQNRVYEFHLEKQRILGNQDAETVYLDFYDMVGAGHFMVIWSCLAVLLGVFALTLPALPIVSLGTGRISRTPLGILLLALCLDAVMVVYGAGLMEITFNGDAARMLQRFFGGGSWGNALTVLNGVYWAVTFAVLFWAALCGRAVFTIGLWRYFKERTVTGLALRGIKRCCRRAKHWWDSFVESLGELDWTEKSNKIIVKIVLVNFLVLTLICCFWFFGIFALIVYSVVLFLVLKRYWERARQKYQILLEAINEMADGNLDVAVEEDLWIFAPFYHELTRIQKGFKKAVQAEVKSQRMKTELVTNVSHDLKTPLTAIITYVNLLKQENLSEEERRNYTEILEKKSMRLKALIEDLFEVSKATSGAATVKLEEVDIVSLLKQVRLELSERIEESGIDFRWNLPEEKIILPLDSQKTYRIFENLLVNIMKYGMPGTRAYIEVAREYNESREGGSEEVTVSMRNISAQELHVNPKELTERFVRGDASRSTEGVGLGLAIAKSFTELQGGTMTVEVEADLFRVIIRWEKKKIEEETESES